jgi:hypothetical protein
MLKFKMTCRLNVSSVMDSMDATGSESKNFKNRPTISDKLHGLRAKGLPEGCVFLERPNKVITKHSKELFGRRSNKIDCRGSKSQRKGL